MGTGNVDGSHLSSFVIPENDDEFVDPDAPKAIGEDGQLVETEAVKLDQAAFYVTLKTLLSVPGMYDKDFLPVAVQSSEEDQARACSDAVYALLEIWYPAALQPNSETLGHLMVAVPFIAGKVMLVRTILITKRMKPVEDARAHAETPQPPPSTEERPQPRGII